MLTIPIVYVRIRVSGVAGVEPRKANGIPSAALQKGDSMGFRKSLYQWVGIKRSGETDSLGDASTAVPEFPNGLKTGSTTLTQAQLESLAGSLIAKGGEVTLDGSNPTPVTVSGITTITSASVSLKATSTPGDDPTQFSVSWSGNTLSIYAYKTDGTDPTLIASTNSSAVVSWVAVGV